MTYVDNLSPTIVADRLVSHFKSEFLAGLASRDDAVLTALARAYCAAPIGGTPPTLRFKLGSIFTAVCISMRQHDDDVVVPDWGKCFKKFCTKLMYPWPHGEIVEAGYEIKLIRHGRALMDSEYELTPLAKEHE